MCASLMAVVQEVELEQPEEEETVTPLSPLTLPEERVVQCRLCDCMVAVRTLDTHVVQCQANSEAARDCNKGLEALAAKMSEEGDMEGEWWWREDVARIMGDARKTDLAHGAAASSAELEDFKQKLDEIKGCEGDVGEAALLGIKLIDQKVKI